MVVEAANRDGATNIANAKARARANNERMDITGLPFKPAKPAWFNNCGDQSRDEAHRINRTLKRKSLHPRNSENEGTNSTVPPKTDRRAGLILLLAEKSIPVVPIHLNGHNGIMTSADKPVS